MINIFPPMFEIGLFMKDNFSGWSNKRKQEIMDSTNMSDDVKTEECNKLYDRMIKYNEKMNFLHNYEIVSEEMDHTGTSKLTVKKRGHRRSSAERERRSSAATGAGILDRMQSARDLNGRDSVASVDSNETGLGVSARGLGSNGTSIKTTGSISPRRNIPLGLLGAAVPLSARITEGVASASGTRPVDI